jgi:hypothetical protein
LVPLDGNSAQKLEDVVLVGWEIALGEATAAAPIRRNDRRFAIRVWDLETGEARNLDYVPPPDLAGDVLEIVGLELAPDRRLISAANDGIRIWNLEDGSSERISERIGLIDLSRDGRRLLIGLQGENQEAVLHDLEQGSSRRLDSHGSADEVALDPAGRFAVTAGAGARRVFRVGLVTDEAPHLLAGVEGSFRETVVSPDGRWITGRIVQRDDKNDILLLPVPDLSQPPLHTLPHDDLLAKLRALTNLRVAEDPESATGWGWALDPFPSWEEVPTW